MRDLTQYVTGASVFGICNICEKSAELLWPKCHRMSLFAKKTKLIISRVIILCLI